MFAVALSGGVLMQLTGCARDEFQPYLAFPIPDKYESARTTKPPQVSRWWTRFGSAELDQVMDVAYVENLDIAVAVSQLDQAEAQVRITGAALWPTINYSENNQRSRSSGPWRAPVCSAISACGTLKVEAGTCRSPHASPFMMDSAPPTSRKRKHERVSTDGACADASAGVTAGGGAAIGAPAQAASIAVLTATRATRDGAFSRWIPRFVGSTRR